MEIEQRGCRSRASSTSSIGREVRCGCQFYQSDSLLPERRALVGRPPSRNMMQIPPPHTRVPHPSEHEYEPIAPPPPPPPPIVNKVAPVVRITDTDVMPVADSDDSIDDRGRFHSGLTLDGDIILPLDGRLEDSAMEGRELGETIDTSEEQESAQQLQDRLEENFLSAPSSELKSRTDGEINTSQVDSTVQEELPGRRGSPGFQDRLRSQAGKLRSRLIGIQKPTFIKPARRRSEKTKSTLITTSEKKKSEKLKSEKSNTVKASKMERFKMALPERPRFSFSSKLSLTNQHKFNIKRPNIHFPSAFNRSRKVTPSPREQARQRSTEPTYGSRKNIFDFSTYPRIFDKKSKNKAEYATSSPKESRAQSAESATFPRTKKSLRARWAPRFGDTKVPDEELVEKSVAIERSRPWRHPSLEEPRLAFRIQASQYLEESEKLRWESCEQKKVDYREEIQYADDEEDSQEPLDQRESRSNNRTRVEENFDPRVYGDQKVDREIKRSGRYDESEDEVEIEEIEVEEVEVLKFKRVESFENGDDDDYEASFPPVDPRLFRKRSAEERSSVRSDREQQQSSDRSCDRRRRGVIEEIDCDEFFLRKRGISQDDMSVGKCIMNEIRKELKMTPENAFNDVAMTQMPPQRPNRTRSLRKRKEDFMESCNDLPPSRPNQKKMLRGSKESFGNLEITGSLSSAVAHRVEYRADTISREQSPAEPSDDMVIVKPAHRRSRSSFHSHSQAITEPLVNIAPSISTDSIPPDVPTRRKRIRRLVESENRQIQNGNGLHQNGVLYSVCNGHGDENNLKNIFFQKHPQKPPRPPPIPPTVSVDHEIMENLAVRLKQEIAERPPVPPKRRSRSRTDSFIQDEDRTSHGAESLPEIGYTEDDIPQDDSREQLPSYAIIEKREKPPRPPPPRRHRHKFDTTPRPMAPKRPQRAYSTLGAARSSPPDTQISRSSEDVTQYIEADSDGEHKNLRSGEVLSKMQGRPLPAPPRPPRSHRAVKESADYYDPESFVLTTEAVASTQTDPLPDDLVIEEEITQVKLIVAPSRSGSQVLISTEQTPTPTFPHTPPIPLLALINSSEDIKVSEEKQTSNGVKEGVMEERPVISDRVEEENQRNTGEILRVALHSDEPLRIHSLEVGDLRVDRLSVSQLEAYKIAVSEIDAIVVSVSEMTGKSSTADNGSSCSLLQELIAIRSHLENLIEVQERPPSRMEDACTATSDERIDAISPTVGTQDFSRRNPAQEVESIPGTGSGRLNVEKMDAIQTKVKQVTNERTQPSSGLENLQAQSLQVVEVKPYAEIKGEMGRATFPSETTARESSMENDEKREQRSESRSKSSSPSCGHYPVRQIASPVKSLPPIILLTPDTPDTPLIHKVSSESNLERETISYSEKTTEQSHKEITHPSQDTLPPSVAQFVTFQASQIPAQFFSLTSPITQQVETEPNIAETTQQLLRALQIIGTRTMRQFVNYIASRVGREESSHKIKEIEVILCALLMIIAGLLIILFANPRTVTHHHHWDYFNPPQ